MTSKVKAYMLRHYVDCVDSVTGLLNHTELAENAACALNLYCGNNDIPDEVFEIAIEVGTLLEKRGLVLADRLN